ncbi:MAG: alkaline phosphatase family protein [Chloroflexi bacterium]|nr:alkaline phosphatase family protein [Chloroflexota bacterium]
MPDLISTLLPRLENHPVSGLNLKGEFIYPSYDGYSLLNLPSSICQLLGVRSLGARPLASEVLEACGDGIQRVILLVVDGLGLELFRHFLEEDSLWKELLPQAVFAPLTSLVPSTTTAALTTLWTGAAPAQHGIVGYELWLREFGVIANMILHSASSANNDAGGLSRSGFHPTTFLPVPALGQHLLSQGVKPYAFMPHNLVHSGLSTMHLSHTETLPYRTPADLWISLRELVAAQDSQKPGESSYIYAYYEEIDGLSHRYGPDDERVAAEFESFTQVFERTFLRRNPATGSRNTLLIVTADHGLIYTPKNPVFDLRSHPHFLEMLHMVPTGDNRLAYLNVRPNKVPEVQEYISEHWPGMFDMLPSGQALHAGLLGPGPVYARTAERLGDLILIARGEAFLWWADRENPLLGRHGGLSRKEMLVPFFALRI